MAEAFLITTVSDYEGCRLVEVHLEEAAAQARVDAANAYAETAPAFPADDAPEGAYDAFISQEKAWREAHPFGPEVACGYLQERYMVVRLPCFVIDPGSSEVGPQLTALNASLARLRNTVDEWRAFEKNVAQPMSIPSASNGGQKNQHRRAMPSDAELLEAIEYAIDHETDPAGGPVDRQDALAICRYVLSRFASAHVENDS